MMFTGATAFAADPLPGRNDESLDMNTTTGGATIGREPGSGDRIMSTPPPKAQVQPDSPPILVVPEIQSTWPPNQRPPRPRQAR